MIALLDELFSQKGELEMKGKAVSYVRMTCEQKAKLETALYDASDLTIIRTRKQLASFGGLPVVTRGSIMDCNLREARPRRYCVDLTKVEL